MSRAAVLLAMLGLALLGGPASAAPTKKKVADAPYPGEFQSRVRRAIANGVQYLRTKQLIEVPQEPGDAAAENQRRDRIEYQEAAAVAWVLRRAGVDDDDPALAKCRERLARRSPTTVEEASLVLLAVCAAPLVEGNPFAMPPTESHRGGSAPLPPEERVRVENLVKFVVSRQVTRLQHPIMEDVTTRRSDDRGGWGGDRPLHEFIADVPTTYLALVGLEAAARAGVAAPASVYLAALDLLVGWQAAKGPNVSLAMSEVRGAERLEWTERAAARGFGHSGLMDDAPAGYFTAAGALGLVVCQDALQGERDFSRELRKTTAGAIRDALAWMQENYEIARNPRRGAKRNDDDVPGSVWHHHWLQGLSRLAIHARMRFVGKHDWYQEGADVLLKAQRADGSWHAIWWSNCYALLFLLRASLPSIVPVTTPSEAPPGPGK